MKRRKLIFEFVKLIISEILLLNLKFCSVRLVANYNMTNIEENVLAPATCKPIIYARYVDDIILVVNYDDCIIYLLREMDNLSDFN